MKNVLLKIIHMLPTNDKPFVGGSFMFFVLFLNESEIAVEYPKIM